MSYEEYKKKGYKDEDLLEILKGCYLENIVSREGGWNAIQDWQDLLSGGQKQRMGMARLVFKKPKFAILDECTSAVSVDVEGNIYNFVKDYGITLLTVSHKQTLWKYHDYLLKLDGSQGWEFHEMKKSE